MTTLRSRLAATVLFSLAATGAMADDTLPYDNGVVVNVTSIRTEPGQFNNYLRYLAGPYRQIMDEAKAQGLIIDYGHYSTQPKTPGDPNLYTIVTYENFAALDGLSEKMAAISAKVFGSMAEAEKSQAERESLRKVIGSERLQKLELH